MVIVADVGLLLVTAIVCALALALTLLSRRYRLRHVRGLAEARPRKELLPYWPMSPESVPHWFVPEDSVSVADEAEAWLKNHTSS